jgi:hypothetical protein
MVNDGAAYADGLPLGQGEGEDVAPLTGPSPMGRSARHVGSIRGANVGSIRNDSEGDARDH